MEARTTDFRPAGPHAQLARPVGARRAPWRLAAGARRARGAPPRRLAAPRPPPAPGQHRPDRPVRRGADVDPPRPHRPRGRRGVARRRARARPSCSRRSATTSAGAAPSTSTSRSTAPSRCCSPTAPFRRSMQRSCRHLLVDEFQDLTPAHVLLVRLLVAAGARRVRRRRRRPVHLRPRRRRPGVPHRLRAAVPRRRPAPADGQLPLPGRGRRRRPHAARLQPPPGPQADRSRAGQRRRRRARCASSSTAATTARDRARSRSSTAWLDEPGVAPASIAVLARVNSLLLAPHVALHEAGVPVSSVLRPDVLERTGMRAALAYLRIAAAGDAMDPGDIVEILRRPTRGLPQWFPDRLHRRGPLVAGPARRARRPGAGQGRAEGAAPGRRPPGRRSTPGGPARRATCSRRCATTSGSARR